MRTIAILGAGLVTEPLADYFIDRPDYRVVMATRTVSKAEQIIGGRPQAVAVAWTADQHDALERIVADADLVASMIPPTMHIPVAEACLRHDVPLVTTSYISPEMAALDAEARDKGLLLLNEIGEDPGLDHMGAMRMIDQIHAEGGKVIALHSYGAGLPSFADNRNPFGYKFSWSPRGVMLAARTSAAYLERGERVDAPGERLFDHHWLVDIEGLGTFETYPNRDSTRYLPHFGLDESVTLYRGLLRFVGWSNTMRALGTLGLLEGEPVRDFEGTTYRQFTASLIGLTDTGADISDVREAVARHLGLDTKADVMERLGWLGLFDEAPVAVGSGANVDVLVDLMLRRMSYGPGEKDMIIVHDEITAEIDDRRERRLSTLVVEGIPNGRSAMSRAVSWPAAIASRLILEGKIEATGVQMPTVKEIYEPVLAELEELGFRFEHRTRPCDDS